VAKIKPDGTGLVYCGYVGGKWDDSGRGIAVDETGCAFILGDCKSDEDTFPVLVGPDLTHNGSTDTFVAKVHANGESLEYCGYIGGSSSDYPWNLDLDPQGRVYVVGNTYSNSVSFPTHVGPDLSYNGGSGDGFVARVSANGKSLEYCGYIGGNDSDIVFAVTADDEGNAFVSGHTGSDQNSFPVRVGPDLTFNSTVDDGFVAKISPSGADLLYCGYIGGDDYDSIRAMDVDALGYAYVSGYTHSDPATFPLKGGPDLTLNGNRDGFVAKVSPSGSGLVYCGYLGGDGYESLSAVYVDRMYNTYFAGRTTSDESSFPVTVGPDLTWNGESDGFVAKLAPPLRADRTSLSVGITERVFFDLIAGIGNAGRNYMLLGGYNGILPGTPLPGGGLTLPLNWDLFTSTVVVFANTNNFHNFMGKLDDEGTSQAVLSLNLFPELVGETMVFAYALNDPWDYVSNPVEIEIIP